LKNWKHFSCEISCNFFNDDKKTIFYFLYNEKEEKFSLLFECLKKKAIFEVSSLSVNFSPTI